MTKQRRASRSKTLGTLALVLFGIVAASTACSDKFSSCEAHRNCPAGGSGGNGTSGHSGDAAGTGGVASNEGGKGGTPSNPGGDGTSGDAGAAGSEPAPTPGVGGTAGTTSAHGGDAAGGSDAEAGSPGIGGAEGGPNCTPRETRACGELYPALKGECRKKTVTCTDDGVWESAATACGKEARNCASSADNDCDGKPDDTVDSMCPCREGDVEACTVGGNQFFGNCNLGLRECVAAENGGTSWGECQHNIPVREVCDDGIDNDCDGAIDEECPCSTGEQRTCGCGTVQTCNDKNVWTNCPNTLKCEQCFGDHLLVYSDPASAVVGKCCVYPNNRGNMHLTKYAVDPEGDYGYLRCVAK